MVFLDVDISVLGNVRHGTMPLSVSQGGHSVIYGCDSGLSLVIVCQPQECCVFRDLYSHLLRSPRSELCSRREWLSGSFWCQQQCRDISRAVRSVHSVLEGGTQPRGLAHDAPVVTSASLLHARTACTTLPSSSHIYKWLSRGLFWLQSLFGA